MNTEVGRARRSFRISSRTVQDLRIAGTIAATALLVDQVTKNLAIARFRSGPIDIPGPFSLRLVANRGALLGIPAPTWVLTLTTFAVATAAVAALVGSPSRRVTIGYGLLVGGAAGNLIDRFQIRADFPSHAVVDWIDTSRFPTFNLADVSILAGLVILSAASRRSPRGTLSGNTEEQG